MFVRRLQGVLVARSYVMMDYDIRAERVEEAVALTPGIESPTVSPLHREGWVAVRSMVPRERAQRVMDELYEHRRARHPHHRHPCLPTLTRRPAQLPSLPLRIRPLGVRFAVYLAGGTARRRRAHIWFAFPPEIRDKFTAFQLATILALSRGRLRVWLRAVAVAGGRQSRRADRRQRLQDARGWSGARSSRVTLKPGSPWAMLDLSDGTSVPALGIQGSDGARATRQVKLLRALVEDNSRTLRND